MRTPLVAGNWKLNGRREGVSELAAAVISGTSEIPVDVLICPSFLHLEAVAIQVRRSALSLRNNASGDDSNRDSGSLAVGAQNCSDQADGAYTGEVSAAMLAEVGAEYVIVGHSERRQLYGESSEQVAARYAQVLDAGLRPILCVGETLDERAASKTLDVIGEQVDAVLTRCGKAGFAEAVIAYEPVWAIGTGETATPEQAQEVHRWLRERMAGVDAAIGESLRILYGGSVKPDNAAELFAQTDIDGGLIGGASLKADDFIAICRAAAIQL